MEASTGPVTACARHEPPGFTPSCVHWGPYLHALAKFTIICEICQPRAAAPPVHASCCSELARKSRDTLARRSWEQALFSLAYA